MLDFVLELVKVVVPIVATALTGLAVWSVKEAKATRDRVEKDSKEARKSSDETVVMVKMAMVVILRQKMVTIHRTSMVVGKIRPIDRTNFFEMDATYRALGGNGVTSHLIDDIRTLPIVEW